MIKKPLPDLVCPHSSASFCRRCTASFSTALPYRAGYPC
ncbi:hypothetical protein I553_10214 [Mycobacterium xenopi 4042]|uniref:Uncharacterized protein n=1 Tax=Mycobacterium xenopi 4042 TaxID=1299334 RepID=X7ZKJ8_MYCXE|nr:hypothetical protein I553_10214 [Mycobacterium xenopi 4042]